VNVVDPDFIYVFEIEFVHIESIIIGIVLQEKNIIIILKRN